ncbi:MAG: Rab family GTPase [Candidatus Hodarchaeales archaeon]|jgi:small GTP-binding protein
MMRKKMEFAEGIFRSNFKIVVLGDGGVGKTAIIQHLLGKEFTSSYLLTIGADISTYKLNHEGKTLSLQIWDLAGQERFDIVRNLYYSGARAAILVFDLTRPESFQNLEKWMADLFLHAGKKIPIILLGNKSDLKGEEFEDDKSVNSLLEKIDKLYDDEYENNMLKVPYLRTSAQTGENILKAFDNLGNVLITYQKQINEGIIPVERLSSPSLRSKL